MQNEIKTQLADAREELEEAKAEVEDGLKELKEGQDKLASEMASAGNKIINGKIEIYVGEATITQTLPELKETKETLKTTISTLNSTYESALKLQNTIDAMNKLLEIEDDTLLEAASGGMTREQVKQARDMAVMSLEALNSGLSTISKSIKELGITIETYKDIPAAVQKLTKSQADLKREKVEQAIRLYLLADLSIDLLDLYSLKDFLTT